MERLIEEGYETLKMPLPALVSVVKEISFPRLPTLRGKQKAKKAELAHWNADNIDIERSAIGLNGSPTRVVKIHHPKVIRSGEIVRVTNEESLADAVERFLKFMRKKKIAQEVIV